MAQKKASGTRNLVSRLRGRVKALSARLKSKKQKSKSMAFGRNRYRGGRRGFFRNPFRGRRSFRQSRPFRKSYGGGGFNRRLPIVGWKIPTIFIWLAIAGGAIFFGKDYIKPLIDKLKSKI